MEKIRVLIVDDSAFMRKSLSIMISEDPSIEVIATANNGLDGYNKAKELKPDIITLDIEMPVMDGLTALKKIMAECPTSVLMVSSLTTEGAESTLKALELGAIDFIPKGMSFVNVGIVNIKQDLINKIKSIGRQKSLHKRLSSIRSRQHLKETQGVSPRAHLTKRGFSAIALGISTGGPLSLQKVIPLISENMRVPLFIVQHMPPKFTKSLADRLNSMSKVKVKEAEDGEKAEGGCVYIAPGGMHMTINKSAGGSRIKIDENPSNTLYRPCVDVMMNSVIDVYKNSILGIIMTGMGKDGYEAIKRLKGLGGSSIAQDEDTCVVYGMPKAIVENNLADIVLPLEKIPHEINRIL